MDNSKKRRARQSNRPADSGRWADFSAERRLRRMLTVRRRSGNLPDELARGADRVTACLPSPPGPASCGQDNSKKRIAKTPSVRVVPDRTGRVKIQRQGPAPSATVARVTHAKLEITAEVVRELLRDQHPDLADRPVTPGARGWVNQLWRLGDDLAVRLPWATQFRRCAAAPAWDLAAGWILLPTGAVDRFYRSYRPAAHGANGADGSHGADAATRRRARGLAVIKALVCILIGDAGEHGRPGGKPTWGPPGHAALQRLTATRQQARDDREAEAK